MEDIESGEAHSEEKGLPETNKKRRFKTPKQVKALEEFYNEHKYPTDAMKAELAEQLDLTERQISGWFCHRRLKDRRLLTEEANATGKQDLSNGVLQDQGSGLRQDSCGSTKRGDYKLAELREVESRRFCDEDLPPTADIRYGQTGQYGTSEMDDTSSESESDLQAGFHPRGRGFVDVETSQYGMPNGSIPPNRGRAGPSGYLKIKGQVENGAITALKRQLGRLYRDDGPSLGVHFDPLPPDAFESPSRNLVHDRSTPIPLDVRGARFPPPTLKSDLYVDASKSKSSHGSALDTLPYRQSLKKKSKNGDAVLSQKSSFSSDEYSAGETSVYDSNMHNGARLKHADHGKKRSPLSNARICPSGGKITGELSESWPHNYEDTNITAYHQRASLESKRSILKSKYKDSLDNEELALPSRIIEPEEHSGERRLKKECQDPFPPKRLMNGMKATKRGRSIVEQDLPARPTLQELPYLTKQIRGSAMDMPSSFSEDETALTSSSVD